LERRGAGRDEGVHFLLAALLPLGDAFVLADGHGCAGGEQGLRGEEGVWKEDGWGEGSALSWATSAKP
jgi:hypothetical protein